VVAVETRGTENESGISQIERIEDAGSERKVDGIEAGVEESSSVTTDAGGGMAGKKTVAPGTKRALLRDARGRWVSSAEALPKLASGETVPPNKAPPQRKTAAKKADPTKEEVAKGHATVVTKLLKNMELKLSGKDAKASLGDYFPNNGLGMSYSGMPFYDAWNTATFLAEFGHAMGVITTNTANPASYPDEVAYLPVVIGNFTTAIMSFVRGSYPTCRFEVLYPTDVNQTAFNHAINYAPAWTPSALTVLKTESFGFTLGRNLDESVQTMEFGAPLGFTASQRSQLVGISDATTPWIKEVRAAAGMGLESVVLFALDQFCLIGYLAPLPTSSRRIVRRGH
jgi:hypothetical protein